MTDLFFHRYLLNIEHMKFLLKQFFCLLLLLGLLSPAFSQRRTLSQSTSDEFCKTMDVLNFQQQADPSLHFKMDAIERHTQQVTSNSHTRTHEGVIQIPVVFHVVYNSEASNVTTAQILSQLNTLNEDFRNRNENRGNTPDIFKHLEADVEIEFCLANIDPNGYKTSGITRTPTYHSNFYINFNGFNFVKFDRTGGRDAWPSDQYLNIWVAPLFGASGLLGYAQFPGEAPETDGIVLDYRFFGTVDNFGYPVFNGRTATHEVGHWLNLHHIWGNVGREDDGCEVDDLVADTPMQEGPNNRYSYPCTFPGPNSCDEGAGDLPDMFQNYMDYSNDICMSLFTKGQKARMRALFEPGGARESLLSSKGCASGLDLALAPQPLCNDGIRNGDEVGVDCGGSCAPCPEDPYCISVGDIPFDEWIESIAISSSSFITFENTSGLDEGYGDYTDTTIVLKPGKAYNLTLIPGYFETPFSEYWKVFIDYNDDQDFEEEGELIYDSQQPVIGKVEGTFTVPEAVSGTARLRVVMKFTDVGFDPEIPDACGVYFFGETEDYTVRFYECDAPKNVSGRIFGEDIVISWEDVLSASAYKVRYYANGAWQSEMVTGSSFKLDNPGAGTYTFEVYAFCEGDWSLKGKIITMSIGSGTAGHRISTFSNPTEVTTNLVINHLYPNPAANQINVSFSTDLSEQVVIRVTDLLGRVLVERHETVTSAVQTARLPIATYPDGVYYLSINDGTEVRTQKFVKE